MSTTGVMPSALPQHTLLTGGPVVRSFDDRVRDGVASLLLAGLAGFTVVRFFIVKRKKARTGERAGVSRELAKAETKPQASPRAGARNYAQL